MKRKWKRLIWIAPLALLGMVVFITIGGEIVMRLWNWLLPPIFGWRQLTVWQGIGLLALCRVLFGGFGFKGSGRCHGMQGMNERWQKMTPEERERFRHGLFGHRPDEPEPKTNM